MYGKPIINQSKTSVSFSHTKDLIACYIDTEGNDIGIDVEHLRKQLPALSKKFINQEDSSPFEDEWHYLFIWSAKAINKSFEKHLPEMHERFCIYLKSIR